MRVYPGIDKKKKEGCEKSDETYIHVKPGIRFIRPILFRC